MTRGQFVAGIGNAYADEILWAARLHPYRKRTQLTAEEIARLYEAMIWSVDHLAGQERSRAGIAR